MDKDTFTCGACKTSFSDLEEFLNHKNTPCNKVTEGSHLAVLGSAVSWVSGNQIATADENGIIEGSEARAVITPAAALDETEAWLKAALPEPESVLGTIFLCKDCNVYSTCLKDLRKHRLELHNPSLASEDDVVRAAPINPLGCTVTRNNGIVPVVKRKRGRPRKYPPAKVDFPFTKTGQLVVEGSEVTVMTTAVEGEKSKEVEGEGVRRPKRGRPRKTEAEKEQAKQKLLEMRQKQAAEEESLTAEEKICRTCGREFARVRQLRSHRCQGGDPDRRSDTESDDEDSAQQNAEMDGRSSRASDPEPLTFNLVATPDQLDSTECAIPQTLNDNALPDLRVSKQDPLKVYTCPICRRLYKTKPSLQVHLSTHTKEKPFSCNQCSYRSSVKGNLKIHMRKHTNERLHCDICNYSCISKGNLKKHKMRHGPKRTPIYCNLCKRRAYTPSYLLHHLEAEHDIQSDPRAKRYYEEQKLKCRVGQRNLLYQCHVCDRKFKDRRSHDAHVLLHRPNKPFKCALCPYAAIRYDAIELHAKRHWFIYVCHLCHTKVLSTELLKTHLSAHSQPPDLNTEDLLKQSILSSMYQCDPIEKELMNELIRKNGLSLERKEKRTQDRSEDCRGEKNGDLGKHDVENETEYLQILSTPAVEQSELLEINKAFAKLNFKRLSPDILREIRMLYGENECPICGKLFRYRPQLEVHRKTHSKDKEFQCNLCPYSSHTKQGLQRHVDTVHVGTRLKCPMCNFETTSSTYLLMHRKKQHLDLAMFKCSQCDMTTASEREMKDHIAARHPELPQSELERIMGKHIHIRSRLGTVASHACKHCGEVFRRVCDLRRHLWLHEGTNPYKCRLCRFQARTLQNLQSHMLRHSDSRTHLCHHCGKMFKMKSALKAHCTSQHPVERLLNCTDCNFTTGAEADLEHHRRAHHAGPSVRTFRCFHCTQYSSSKEELREHYRQEHPDAIFDEGLAYEVPEERITTLNISIHQTDGVLQYKCSQCDVLLINNGELGQHLRDVHGLAITTVAEGDSGEMNPEQLSGEHLNDQRDATPLSPDSQAQMTDPATDERTSAMELLQHIIDIQEIAQVSSVMEESSQQQQNTSGDNKKNSQVDEQGNMPETVAAVNYLTASENMTNAPDAHQSQQNLQTVSDCHEMEQTVQHDGSSEDIPVAVFEQEVTDGVMLEAKGHMTYVLPEQRQPSS
ncbi:zinc finger protein ZFAT-like [Acanthaster planci]|uniref:Zinc finger protein ZFAT-like n=1 Tax=Acanthaster planci TaxID=133434 RepID=A0A8B7XQX5_ACAPL|nr:zinc finger protein ZFAT-like [Acanthaster planci]XP_022082406.1 zinc finger protein ZFAT-like [Acanthaster planci]XP_022082407.1 zinc finger protein ZFAT-like [Acanthaster planci]XP_022082408.1 zinc finger protein ZFAT-like [Acanthaster planci]